MKINIELPDMTLRRARDFAAARGIALRRFFTNAVAQQLRRRTVAARDGAHPRDTISGTSPESPWMAGFGGLADLGDEHRLVLHTIEDEFERLDPYDGVIRARRGRCAEVSHSRRWFCPWSRVCWVPWESWFTPWSSACPRGSCTQPCAYALI